MYNVHVYMYMLMVGKCSFIELSTRLTLHWHDVITMSCIPAEGLLAVLPHSCACASPQSCCRGKWAGLRGGGEG